MACAAMLGVWSHMSCHWPVVNMLAFTSLTPTLSERCLPEVGVTSEIAPIPTISTSHMTVITTIGRFMRNTLKRWRLAIMFVQYKWNGKPVPVIFVIHDGVLKWKLFSALLALCEGESIGHWWIPLTRGQWREALMFLYIYIRLNKRLSKQWRRWWFEMPWCSLWRHCNVTFGVYGGMCGQCLQLRHYSRQVLIWTTSIIIIIVDTSQSYYVGESLGMGQTDGFLIIGGLVPLQG